MHGAKWRPAAGSSVVQCSATEYRLLRSSDLNLHETEKSIALQEMRWETTCKNRIGFCIPKHVGRALDFGPRTANQITDPSVQKQTILKKKKKSVQKQTGRRFFFKKNLKIIGRRVQDRLHFLSLPRSHMHGQW